MSDRSTLEDIFLKYEVDLDTDAFLKSVVDLRLDIEFEVCRTPSDDYGYLYKTFVLFDDLYISVDDCFPNSRFSAILQVYVDRYCYCDEDEDGECDESNSLCTSKLFFENTSGGSFYILDSCGNDFPILNISRV